MNIASAKELRIIKGLPPVAKKGDRVAMDTEFFGQIKGKLHRPHGTFAFLGASYDGEIVYYVTDESEIQEFLNRVDAGVWIFHHAKYDVNQLRRFAPIPARKNLWDTMLIEQIMYSGYYSEFSLADVVRRHCDTYMSKEVREEFSKPSPKKDVSYVEMILNSELQEMGTFLADEVGMEMTKEQVEYAAVDVAYTWRVAKVQKNLICEDDLRIYREIELPFLWTLLSMSGVRLDTEKWTALAKKNEETAREIQAKYGHEEIVEPTGRARKPKKVFVGINLNSPAQVKAHLKSLGWPVASTDAETLDKISDECEFANDMCVYRTYSKRSSTYGVKFIEDHVEPDGKIYADIYQIGAETGRTSCRAPNLQNQPHEVEYRECFIADEGECAVVADWGAQEPRFAAYFSGDGGLIDALNSEEKLYVRIGREALGIDITKNDPEYKHLKSTVLGLFYGMSAMGLAKRLGLDDATDDEKVRHAQHMIDSILETYPGIKDYMRTQKRAKDYVQSVTGRKIWLNKYSFQWERNALNAPIQSSAADAMKIASSVFAGFLKDVKTQAIYEFKKRGWRLVLLVHDEVVIMVPKDDQKEAEYLLKEIMIGVAESLHTGIKGSVEIFHGPNWACKV